METLTNDKSAQPRVPLAETRNGLPASVREAMVQLLNRRLADAVDLQSQCKQAHWNVKGRQFYGLHKLFDDVHEAVSEYVDDLAERVAQLGGRAMGTVRAAAAASRLPEYPAAVTGEDHAAALTTALAAFGKAVREAVDDAQEGGDAATADLFTEVSRGTDQWLWFVESHLLPRGEGR